MSGKINFTTNLELNTNYDVIIAGGGPAGCSAAIAAAREGAKVLLIEATGCLGGMGTAGLVPAWCPFTNYERIIYGGLAEKILRLCIAGMPHVPKDHFNWTPIDAELLKRIYDDMVTGSGAEVLFNTQLAAVNMNGNAVDSIVVANKAGLTAYKASVYIDGTGDGDLAAWAGAEYEKGDEVDGDLQPVTHCFLLTNVDEYGYRTGEPLHSNNKNSPIYDIRKSGRYPLISDHHCCNNLVGPGAVGFNAGHMWQVDNTDPLSVSKALIHGRKIAHEFQQSLAEFQPKAFANAFLASTASLLGCRETRRIIGDYYLQVEELMAFKSFDDEICRNSYFIDVHHAAKAVGTDKEGVEHQFRFPTGTSHGIPYRCLTPKGIINVLIAGRSISTDRPTQGSTRVMPVCLVMGEAAGIASAMAVKSNHGDVHAVDTAELRRRLTEYGAYLPEVH